MYSRVEPQLRLFEMVWDLIIGHILQLLWLHNLGGPSTFPQRFSNTWKVLHWSPWDAIFFPGYIDYARSVLLIGYPDCWIMHWMEAIVGLDCNMWSLCSLTCLQVDEIAVVYRGSLSGRDFDRNRLRLHLLRHRSGGLRTYSLEAPRCKMFSCQGLGALHHPQIPPVNGWINPTNVGCNGTSNESISIF